MTEKRTKERVIKIIIKEDKANKTDAVIGLILIILLVISIILVICN